MNELIGKWNYYFLRYGAGTVIGAGIMAFVFTQCKDVGWSGFHHWFPHVKDGKSIFDGSGIIVLAAIGFAFCYVASAPGLVFHTARGAISHNDKGVGLALGLSLILNILIISLLYWKGYFLSDFAKQRPIIFGIALVFSFTIFLWQIVFLCFAFCRHQKLKTFYRCLTQKRTDKSNEEYVESYRHIREHANAFEIIFLELILATTLISFPLHLFVVLAIWVLPSAFCWITGTMLEKCMAYQKFDFEI